MSRLAALVMKEVKHSCGLYSLKAPEGSPVPAEPAALLGEGSRVAGKALHASCHCVFAQCKCCKNSSWCVWGGSASLSSDLSGLYMHRAPGMYFSDVWLLSFAYICIIHLSFLFVIAYLEAHSISLCHCNISFLGKGMCMCCWLSRTAVSKGWLI